MGDLLYAQPTFLEGVGRVFDFGGTLSEFNRSLSPEQADYFALRADWIAVGDALRAAIVKSPEVEVASQLDQNN